LPPRLAVAKIFGRYPRIKTDVFSGKARKVFHKAIHRKILINEDELGALAVIFLVIKSCKI